jgi:hypothetical protein
MQGRVFAAPELEEEDVHSNCVALAEVLLLNTEVGRMAGCGNKLIVACSDQFSRDCREFAE